MFKRQFQKNVPLWKEINREFDMTISRINSSALPRLDSLVYSYPFHPYRAHKILNQRDIRTLALDNITRMVQNSTVAFHSIDPDGEVIAIVEKQKWDTDHFGFPNYRLGLLQSPGATDDTLSDLVALACREVRREHERFNIAIEIDEHDYRQINAVIRQGFQLRDHKRTYVAKNAGAKPGTDIRKLHLCRKYEEKDKPRIHDLLKGISFPSRFTRDPCFSTHKVAEMYEIWTENLLCPPFRDRPVLVVENSMHDIIAFGACQDIELGTTHDPKTLCGNSLFFSDPRFPGGCISFLQHLRTKSIKHYKAFELIVSASNLPAIRALEKTGFTSAPGRYSFHLNDLS